MLVGSVQKLQDGGEISLKLLTAGLSAENEVIEVKFSFTYLFNVSSIVSFEQKQGFELHNLNAI